MSARPDISDAPYYTAWVRLDLCARYGGQKSHTARETLEYTLCGLFVRYALGDYGQLNTDVAPTCKRCRDRDPRFASFASRPPHPPTP